MPLTAGRAGACARRKTAYAVVAAAALAAALPAAAPAQSMGGAEADFTPVVHTVECRKLCAGALPSGGSTIAMEGDHLRGVVSVRFLGRRRVGDDDVRAEPYRTSQHRLLVVVPTGAVRGRAVAVDGEGTASKPSPVIRLPRPAKLEATDGGPIATAVTTRKAFFDGARRPTLTYELRTGAPASAAVHVVRESDGAVLTTFDQGRVAPGEQRSVSWDGKVAGVPQPDGRYAFVVVARDDASGFKASTAQAGTSSADAFTLLGHRFPVRGPHDYGGHEASFGGGRGHQGHDVFAKCGTPLVAARGGVVKMKRWQDRAGHYVVIDGEGTGVDYAYMHLRDPALVEQRDRVYTGQLIGHVGDTGRAFGCHLHFEEWSAPGWYTGGSPFDPLPDLKAWDAVS